METGQKIRYERKKQGLSMKKLGEAIGLSEQAIAHYEKGTRRISFDTLKKIANVLNLPISAFNPDNIEGYTDFGNGIKGFGIGEKITLRNMIYSLYDPYMGMGKEEILNMCEKAIKILKLYNLEISFIRDKEFDFLVHILDINTRNSNFIPYQRFFVEADKITWFMKSEISTLMEYNNE